MDSLEKIKEEIINCKKCSLYKGRHHPVVGAGNMKARVMFVGEAPGANEDRTGLPFCGAAGRILDELLVSAGLTREDVYITNILKCRPPNNRDPESEEIKSCTPYLDRQIEVIRPEVLCCLGNFATRYIMSKYGFAKEVAGITKIHGKVFFYQTFFESLKIIPLYHPAAATYNVNLKETLIKDFKVLKEVIS